MINGTEKGLNGMRFAGLTALLLMVFGSCKEVYKPRLLSSPQSYLVVEGVLVSGGPTLIRISRTTNLETTSVEAERAAQVSVEGKDNSILSLIALGNGYYQSPDAGIKINGEYRLRIVTRGKEYLSDYIKARKTPAIDSVFWRQEEEGLRIMLNTHDATDSTRYYRWEFNETWEVRSYFRSIWIYIKDSNYVRRRSLQEEVSVGWKNDSSKNILIGSTAHLQSDIVFRAPVIFIPAGDERPAERYSIIVRQYALDKPAFGFYELMKKNTEELGTIFDPQPSEVSGNIHCVNDPGEPVIGYITASTMEEKRIFISSQELVRWNFRQNCDVYNVDKHPDTLKKYFGSGYMPIDEKPTYYPGALGKCVDVTVRGASLLKPAFW
jgi:hypothetical protein